MFKKTSENFDARKSDIAVFISPPSSGTIAFREQVNQEFDDLMFCNPKADRAVMMRVAKTRCERQNREAAVSQNRAISKLLDCHSFKNTPFQQLKR